MKKLSLRIRQVVSDVIGEPFGGPVRWNPLDDTWQVELRCGRYPVHIDLGSLNSLGSMELSEKICGRLKEFGLEAPCKTR